MALSPSQQALSLESATPPEPGTVLVTDDEPYHLLGRDARLPEGAHAVGTATSPQATLGALTGENHTVFLDRQMRGISGEEEFAAMVGPECRELYARRKSPEATHSERIDELTEREDTGRVFRDVFQSVQEWSDE